MSEKERDLAKKIADLPPEVQDRFLAQVQGAVTVLDVMSRQQSQDKEAGDA